jgi:3D (Asp-Asp-Asp) domain-containing protein
MPARKGVVAVDPDVVALGTKLYVEGYGFAIAADRGRAIQGKRIDLCYNTRREALRFGRRVVKVHILKTR